MSLYGIIGTSMILTSLLLQFLDLIRKSNAKVSLKFLFMNAIGSLFILFHTILIQDPILIIFNLIAFTIAISSLGYAIKTKKYF